MNKQQVAVLIVALVLCVLAGIAMPMIDQADALAPVDVVVDKFLHHLNTIQ